MVVRSAPQPFLLVGDLTYDVDLMRQGTVPGIGSRAESAASTRSVLELAARLGDAAILPAHDPATATRLRAAGGGAT